MIHSDKIMTIICRTLNRIDRRLVDHGIRVALVLGDMLKAEGCQDAEQRKTLSILALLHDVGAYRTEEIQNMIHFETGNVWAHSIYGYLFLREFTPLGDWAKVVLYHHADYRDTLEEPEWVRHYAQMLYVADRAVVWHDEVQHPSQELWEHLDRKKNTAFAPDVVSLLREADRQYHTMARLDSAVHLGNVMDCHSITAEEARAYLVMVAHTIDFRSHVTVAHTMSVMEIGARLAETMGLPPSTRGQIYYGGLLHDLGKISTPLAILEKPGRLTKEEAAIMREHVTVSGQIIDGCVEEAVARIASRHHEKLDGSGYPLGLSGEELTLPERILAVADIVSALCMSRSYKEAFPKERCLSILRDMEQKGQLDTRVVDTMGAYFDEILSKTNEACQPYLEAYERINAEYPHLLEKYSKGYAG